MTLHITKGTFTTPRAYEDRLTTVGRIYVELADQYKVIDAASNVAKRNVLAEHLREVIDTLEQKVHYQCYCVFSYLLTLLL